jgi:glyoxylase-like metal-dependent hydrolase (beta-lactamase superfamily II)
MHVQHFHDPATSTLTYLVHDEATRDAIVIDPVLDDDAAGAQSFTASIERVAQVIREQGLRLRYVLETHVHADHLSGSQYLRERFGAGVAIGRGITQVQETFKALCDLPQFPADGRQFDRLLGDGETLRAGSLEIEAIATPGHTPACMTYHLGDAIFTGDALFIEDLGVGRCDFPGGSASDLYHSVHGRLYALPDSTRVFVGHDYQPGGRELRFETTLAAEKTGNLQLKAATSEADFVRARTERDSQLQPPRLLFQAVRFNIDAGRPPTPHSNDVRERDR